MCAHTENNNIKDDICQPLYLPKGYDTLASFLESVDQNMPECLPNQSGLQSDMSSSTNIARKLSNKESRTESSTMPRSLETSGASTEPRTEDEQTSSLRGSHNPANRFPSLGSARVKQTNGTCGLTPSESLAKYDPDSHSWKTYQLLLMPMEGTSEESLEDFPKSGMIVDGLLYRLPMSEHRTLEKGCGYWRTPSACDGMGGPHKGKRHRPDATIQLRDQVANRHMWPTPKERDYKGMSQRGIHAPMDCLPNAVAHGGTSTRRTYPTPRGSTEGIGMCGGTGAFQQIQNLDLPENEKKAMAAGNGGQLSPMWVEWLMGYPIGSTALKGLEMRGCQLQQWKRGFGLLED